MEWVRTEIGEKFATGELTVFDIKNFISINTDKEEKLKEMIPNNIVVSIFSIDCSNVRDFLTSK